MKLQSSVVAVLLLFAACGGDDDSGGDGSHADADPSAPDADPNAPDGGPVSAQIFDHHHIDVADIAPGCLDDLKSGDFVFHYAHRSHGSQIIVGAESLEAEMADLAFEASYCSVPGESDVLPMWDGMTEETGNLITQEAYWDSEDGLNELRGLLQDNPELKYTMWAWSFEINEQTESTIDDYLSILDGLEDEFPDVRFIYMTGPAVPDPFMAVERRDRNQQIRDYAMNNGKLLFDFEELDAWSNGESYSEEVEGEDVPMEHPDFQVEEPGFEFTHTSEANCVQKARAFWGMMAQLECGG